MSRLAPLCALALTVLTPMAGNAETLARIGTVFERAKADVFAERYGNAYQRFQWLLLNDTKDAKRTKAYQTALHRLKTKHPLSFGASAALMPSSNISKTFNGNETLRASTGDARPGVGLRFDAFAQATESYAPGREVVARVGLGRSLFDDRRLNSQSTKFTLAHRWLTAGATYGLAGFSNRTRFEPVDDIPTSDVDSHGARFTLQRTFDNGHSFGGTARYEIYDYLNSSYLDGYKAQIQGSYSIPLSPAESLNVTAGIEQADLTNDTYSYTSFTLGTRYTRSMASGLTWGLGATHSYRAYDDVFPLDDPIVRTDNVTDLSISLSHRAIKIGDSIPRVSCTQRRHGSNIYLYDYTSVDCSMQLQFDF